MVNITEYVTGQYKANNWIINSAVHVKYVEGDNVGIYDNGLRQYIIKPTVFSDWNDPSGSPYASLADLISDLNTFFFDISASSLYQEVNTFADLPDPTLNAGVTYHVINATGLWILGTRRQSGLYRSNGTSWILRNDISSLLIDSEFNIRDDADNTKGIRFVLDSLTTGLLRAITWPDKDGTVAMLDDVITAEERRKINGHASAGGSVSINVNQVVPAIIPMDAFSDNNPAGLTIGPNGGLEIPADYAGFWAVEYKFTYDFTNRSDITGGIDINNTGVIIPETVAPTYNTRNVANPAGSVICGWTPIGSLSVGDEVILKAFRAGTQAGNVPLNAGETVLTLHYLGT